MGFTWKTKSGQEIPIESLTADHLANAKRMFERKNQTSSKMYKALVEETNRRKALSDTNSNQIVIEKRSEAECPICFSANSYAEKKNVIVRDHARLVRLEYPCKMCSCCGTLVVGANLAEIDQILFNRYRHGQ